MAGGGYRGGSTIIRPGQGWFSGESAETAVRKKKSRKTKIVTSATKAEPKKEKATAARVSAQPRQSRPEKAELNRKLLAVGSRSKKLKGNAAGVLGYDFIEHRHRLAAWAAARAASRGVGGLTVRETMTWLKAIGLRDMLAGWDCLPAADKFDSKHTMWCTALMAEAKAGGRQLQYGGAAKIINCYLKVGVVVATCDARGLVAQTARARIGAIHPPIDSILLDALKRRATADERNILIEAGRWSTMDETAYLRVVAHLRKMAKRKWPDQVVELWRFEQWWDGYRPTPARSPRGALA